MLSPDVYAPSPWPRPRPVTRCRWVAVVAALAATACDLEGLVEPGALCDESVAGFGSPCSTDAVPCGYRRCADDILVCAEPATPRVDARLAFDPLPWVERARARIELGLSTDALATVDLDTGNGCLPGLTRSSTAAVVARLLIDGVPVGEARSGAVTVTPGVVLVLERDQLTLTWFDEDGDGAYDFMELLNGRPADLSAPTAGAGFFDRLRALHPLPDWHSGLYMVGLLGTPGMLLAGLDLDPDPLAASDPVKPCASNGDCAGGFCAPLGGPVPQCVWPRAIGFTAGRFAARREDWPCPFPAGLVPVTGNTAVGWCRDGREVFGFALDLSGAPTLIGRATFPTATEAVNVEWMGERLTAHVQAASTGELRSLDLVNWTFSEPLTAVEGLVEWFVPIVPGDEVIAYSATRRELVNLNARGQTLGRRPVPEEVTGPPLLVAGELWVPVERPQPAVIVLQVGDTAEARFGPELARIGTGSVIQTLVEPRVGRGWIYGGGRDGQVLRFNRFTRELRGTLGTNGAPPTDPDAQLVSLAATDDGLITLSSWGGTVLELGGPTSPLRFTPGPASPIPLALPSRVVAVASEDAAGSTSGLSGADTIEHLFRVDLATRALAVLEGTHFYRTIGLTRFAADGEPADARGYAPRTPVLVPLPAGDHLLGVSQLVATPTNSRPWAPYRLSLVPGRARARAEVDGGSDLAAAMALALPDRITAQIAVDEAAATTLFGLVPLGRGLPFARTGPAIATDPVEDIYRLDPTIERVAVLVDSPQGQLNVSLVVLDESATGVLAASTFVPGPSRDDEHLILEPSNRVRWIAVDWPAERGAVLPRPIDYVLEAVTLPTSD